MDTNKQRKKYYIIVISSVIMATLLDQLTKFFVVKNLKGKEPFVIINDIFQLEYLENRGAAFGLFQNQRIFFYISVIIISIVIIWFLVKVPLHHKFIPMQVCAIFILAGAYGNCIDRIRLNYVVDFLYFKLIDFPIFNVADIYVTLSTIVLVLLMFFYYKEEDFERIFHR